MSKNQKDINRDVHEISEKLPSRMEVHGQKNRKKKNKSDKEDNQSKQKKIRISIPLILLVILLLLPGTYAIYLLNKEKNLASSSAKGVGEEISYVEDNSIETSIDNKESSNTPDNATNDEKMEQEHQNEEVENKGKESEQENETITSEEKEADHKINTPEETENGTEQIEKIEEKVEEAKIVYHTVQKGETLFRISMQYYKSQDGIEKIKEANGIADNEIMVGQSLKIPLP
ncbi:LysM peptidoglycan-binding domain-containing protein [Lederbergia panacisoli]|uniref:LysM peptidoglycan-binding domain-containing protein n=1 Tax=Lederbergia panacisoli TaxID=1255251 RepID=UPI00214A8DDE|nr:LysM peptidoglycan-binding domain-containing protein [Lederbergia panacisoli]MCR2820265.1 LysM peptidoglycan-binding domain-containing protein [Lederbergia panacisoli]